MLNAPTHRVDAPAIFVLDDDTAWDKPRIVKEIAALKKAKHDTRHPATVYSSGETRYDLGATIRKADGTEGTAADYLNTSQALQFHLKRLQWDEVYALQPSMGTTQGQALACRMSLERVEGPGAPLITHDEQGYVDRESMQRLFNLGMGLPLQVGFAGFTASLPLSAAEKKP